MALWEDSATGQPKWLLGEDNNVGLGSNHIKGITNITDGNEIETIDDVANGWVQWHSKENGKILGEGRGWWELLATMTMSGTHITVNQRPVATSEIAVEVTQAEVDAGNAGEVDVNIEATDSSLGALTYTLTDGFTAAGATLSDAADGTVTIDGTPGIFAWNVSDNLGVTMATDVTVTITNPDPTVAAVTNLEYDLNAPANVTDTLTGVVGLVGGTVASYTVDANGVVPQTSTATATASVDNEDLTITIVNNDDDLVVGDTITFNYTMTNSGDQTSDSAIITVTVKDTS